MTPKRSTRIDIWGAQAGDPLKTNVLDESLKDSSVPTHSPSTGRSQLRNATGKIIKGKPKELRLPGIVEDGDSVIEFPIIRNQSPWQVFRSVFTCNLAGKVSIVVRRQRPSNLMAVRASTSSKEARRLLECFRQTKHENILGCTECYIDNGINYFLVDDMPLNLDHLVACPAYPTETQLASIIGQVLDGVSYLLVTGLQHESLTSSNILINEVGLVKIAALSECVDYTAGDSQSSSISAVAYLAVELMQKYAKHNIGVDDTTRWPIGSDAVGFLLSATSAKRIDDLREHSLLKTRRSSPAELVSLVRLALVSASITWSYSE